MKLSALIVVLFFSFASFAQCKPEWAKHDPKDKMAFYAREFSAETMDALKKTTTVFFYRDLDSAKVGQFRQVFSEAWDITPIILDNGRKF